MTITKTYNLNKKWYYYLNIYHNFKINFKIMVNMIYYSSIKIVNGGYMEAKKILITYATYGSGHKTVASYIYEYFKKHGNYEIKMLDLMDYENIIGFLSKKAFEQNFKYRTSSAIFSFIYELFDFKTTTLGYKYVVKSIFKNKKMQREIVSFNPDLLISTHFFGNIILGMLNKKKLTHAKIISIITDYHYHEMWLKDEKSIDALIVSNDILKNKLIEKGIAKNKIYAYGIPISETFSSVESLDTIKNKYHVNNGKKIFLFFAGGSIGSSFSYKYLKKLLEKQYDINIIYVCGKNEKLRSKVEKTIDKYHYENVYPLGFSKEVNNLLSIADIVITKPGGLSITESLEMHKPMLLIPGNGGNEIYNARFVSKNGYGINCHTPNKLVKNVGKLLKKPNMVLNMKRKINNYNDNNSIMKIYKLSNKMLK